MFDLTGAALPFDEQRASDWARTFGNVREWDYRPTDPGILHRFRRLLGAPEAPRHAGHALLGGLNPLRDLRQDLFLDGAPRPTDSNTFGHEVEHVLLGRHRGHHCVVFGYHWGQAGDDRRDFRGQTVWSLAALHLGYRAPDLTVLPRGRWTIMPPSGTEVSVGHPGVDQHYRVWTSAPAFATDLLRSPVGDHLASRLVAFHVHDDSLVVTQGGYLHRFPVDVALDDLAAIAERVPDHVRARLGGAAREQDG